MRTLNPFSVPFRVRAAAGLMAVVLLVLSGQTRPEAQAISPVWVVDDVSAVDLGQPNCQLMPRVNGFGFGADGAPLVGWTQVEGCGGSNVTHWGEKTADGWQRRVWNYGNFWSSPNGAAHEFGVGGDGRPYLFMVGGDANSLTYHTYVADLRAWAAGQPGALQSTGEHVANHQECVYVRYRLSSNPNQAVPYRVTARGRCDNAGPFRFEGQQLSDQIIRGFDLAMGPDGRAHIAFIDATGRAMYQRPGLAAVHVGTVNPYSDDVAVAAGRDGTLHLLARGFNSTADYDRGRVGYLRSTDDGATWAFVDYADQSHQSYGLSLQMDALDAPAVAFWRYGSGLIYSTRATGAWSETRITAPGFSGVEWVKPPVLRFDQTGTPHVAYYDWAANRIRVASPVPAGVAPPVDLAVAGHASPNPASAGVPVSFTASVTNTAPREATGVRVRVTLPAGAGATNFNPAPISNAGGVLTFDSWRIRGGGVGRDALPGQAVGTMRFDITGLPTGVVDVRVEATSIEVDDNSADNDVSVSVRVNDATCAAPASGRVAWWPADGTALNYGAGPAYHGTTVGAVTFEAGAVGQAFRLDGAGSYVNVPNGYPEQYWPGTQALSVAAWFATSVTSATSQVVASMDDMAHTACCGSPQGWAAWYLYVHNGVVRASARQNPYGSASVTITGTTPVADGQFHHAAVVIDIPALEMRLYVDGQLDAAAPLPVGWAMSNGDYHAEPLVIGAAQTTWADGYVSFFNGAVDDVSLYKRVLTAVEIANAASGPSRQECGAPEPPDSADVRARHVGIEQDAAGLPVAVFTVTNDGPDAATNVQVSTDPAVPNVMLPSLAAGVTETLRVRIDPHAEDKRERTVSIVASAETADPDGSNNADTHVVTVPLFTADLRVRLDVSPESYEVGAVATFVAQVVNDGPARSAGATVTLSFDGTGPVPDGCIAGPVSAGRLNATCALGPMESGQLWTTTATTTNTVSGQRTSSLAVGSSDFRMWVVDSNGTNDAMAVTVDVSPGVVNRAPELAPTPDQRWVDPVDANATAVVLRLTATDPDGDSLTWTASGLPAGFQINSTTGRITGAVEVPNVLYREDGHAAVQVTDPAGATATQTFNWSIQPGIGSLAVSIDGSPEVDETGHANLRVRVTNVGFNHVSTASVQLDVDAGAVVSAGGCGQSFIFGVPLWICWAESLAPQTFVEYVVRVHAPGATRVTATLRESSPLDTTAEDNVATVVVNPNKVDLALTLSAPGTVVSGSDFLVTATVQNLEAVRNPDGTVVAVTVPDVDAVQPLGGAGCTVAGETTRCQVSGPAAGGSATVTLRFRAGAGVETPQTVTLTGHVSHADVDPVVTNNQSSTTFTIEPAPEGEALSDLAIVSAVGPASVRDDEVAMYTVVVRNNGPRPATGVTVWPLAGGGEPQPPQLLGQLVESSTCRLKTDVRRLTWQGGTTTFETGRRFVCEIETLGVGESVVVTFGRRPAAGDDPMRTPVEVTGAVEDPNPANNWRVLLTPVSWPADLAVSVRAPRRLAPTASEDVQVQVRNTGSVAADQSRVAITLEHLSSVSLPQACAVTGPRVECSLGRIEPGRERTVTVRVRPTITLGLGVVRATASSATRDASQTNNTATSTIEIVTEALRTDVSASASAEAGTATVRVINHGPSAVTEGTASLTLTASKDRALGVDVSGWGITPDCVYLTVETRIEREKRRRSGVLQSSEIWLYRCAIAAMVSGGSTTFTITPSIVRPANVSVSFSLDEGSWRNMGIPVTDQRRNNDNAGVAFQSYPQADLEVVSVSAPQAIASGGVIAYEVTVRNNGPATARGVAVGPVNADGTPLSSPTRATENQPWVASSSCGWVGRGMLPNGSAFSYVYECPIDDLTPGETVVVRFERRTSASDRWVVVPISVRAPVADAVPANNQRSVTTQVIGGRR